MPIAQLPGDVTRLLQAHIAISSPVSVVKELLENSIDAGATVVDVLLSQNTTDRIEVRDDGSGIDQEDFEAFGRCGHTSKLSSVKDLQLLGGSTLGFRGEAVAAIATVASSVTVTTKTATDIVATVFDLLNNGKGSLQISKRSTLVGTTVAVSDLFSRLPVRRKSVLRDVKANIANVKQLIMAYALTRPHLKLSLKLIGAPLPSLSYSPRPVATVKTAALDLFGPGLVSQCTDVVFRVKESRCCRASPPPIAMTDSERDGQASGFSGGIEITALVPKLEAVVTKISSKGAFFAVDGRPVSASRGVFKKIYGLFKRHISQNLQRCEASGQLRDPFLVLHIKSPQGSYDVNVEPSKDDVLFASEQDILDACEGFFKETYSVTEHQGTIRCDETARPLEVTSRLDERQLYNMQTLSILEDTTEHGSNKSPVNVVTSSCSVFDDSQQTDAISEPSHYEQISAPTDGYAPQAQALNTCRIKKATPQSNFQWSVNMDAGESSDEESVTLDPESPKCDYTKGGSLDSAGAACDAEDGQLCPENMVSQPLEAVNPWVIAKMNGAITRAQVSSNKVFHEPALNDTANCTSEVCQALPKRRLSESRLGCALQDGGSSDEASPLCQSPSAFKCLDLPDSGSKKQSRLEVSHRIAAPGSGFGNLVSLRNRNVTSKGASSRRAQQHHQEKQVWYGTPPSSSSPRAEKRYDLQNPCKKAKARRAGGGSEELKRGSLAYRDPQGVNAPKEMSDDSMFGSRQDFYPYIRATRQPVGTRTPSHHEQFHNRTTQGLDKMAGEPSITTAGALMQLEATVAAGEKDDEIFYTTPVDAESYMQARRMDRHKRLKRKSSKLPLETPSLATLHLVRLEAGCGIGLILALHDEVATVDDYMKTGTVCSGDLMGGDVVGELKEELGKVVRHILEVGGEGGEAVTSSAGSMES